MIKFLVLGLPRSRTAWLSVFLSHDGNYCHHEGINGCRSLSEYYAKVDGYGDSTTAGMLCYGLDVPTLIIERDPSYAIKYCEEVFRYSGDVPMRDLRFRLNRVKGLRVHFDTINDRLEEIWAYLIGTPYNDERGKALSLMNIQVEDPHCMVVHPEILREIVDKGI